MYRNLSTILLCISAVLGAPQKDSNITYIKINQQPEARYASREATYNEEGQKDLASNLIKEPKTDASVTPVYETPQSDYSERVYSIRSKPKKNKKPATDNTTATVVEVVNDSANVTSDILPSESFNTDIFYNTEVTTQRIDSDITENYAIDKFGDETTILPHIDIETTKEPILVLPPKLSYYGKSNFQSSFSQNLIAHAGKSRRFRSRCRCERIWNCTNLQISIARCPDEYFLCCG